MGSPIRHARTITYKSHALMSFLLTTGRPFSCISADIRCRRGDRTGNKMVVRMGMSRPSRWLLYAKQIGGTYTHFCTNSCGNCSDVWTFTTLATL